MTTLTAAQSMELAKTHLKAARLADAESACRHALVLEPNDPYAHALLGTILRRQRRYADAVAALQHALQIKPDWPQAQNNLGNNLADLGLMDQAIAAFQRALKLNPDLPEVHGNLGNVLRKLGQLDQAEAAYGKSLSLRQSIEIQNNLGGLLAARGQFAQAAQIHQNILAAHPDYAPAHWDLALLLLLQGDYQRGWPEYEWRWRVPDLRLGAPLNTPRWRGEDLAGKTILIHTEQGLGDAIQFCRFIPSVAERAGKLILLCQRELLPLFERLPGVAQCLPRDQQPPAHDVHCPLLSLPMILGITLENLPAAFPYLSADAALVQKWADNFSAEKRRKIGIVWAGRSYPDPARSAPLAEMAALGQVPGICWISLQTGDAAFEPPPPNFTFIDCGRDLKNLHDTAAILAGLDQIVTIDTATAHLAGAMGKPTCVLLKNVADWRWMRDRDDCPWYPTLRLFRQPRPGDWQTPINQIIHALQTS
jgi:Flp pilus assembly protein TadD